MQPSFPLPCLDVRPTDYMPGFYVLVLKGDSSPPARPLFSWDQELCEVEVDDQGIWGVHEWSLLPQLYDPSSPWLACIPLYHDNEHFSRYTINRDMMEDAPRTIDTKEPHLLQAALRLRDQLKGDVRSVIESTEEMVKLVQQNDAFGHEMRSQIIWPEKTLERATYLRRQLIVGVTSVNAFKRCLTALRRLILELDGFTIWATLMQALPSDRVQLALKMKEERKMEYRGVFLHGSQEEWLNEGSDVRTLYTGIAQWMAPIYALVRVADWCIQPHVGLKLNPAPFPFIYGIQEREARQLIFYCYPPKVPAARFESSARGVSPHSEEGERGAIGDLYLLNAERAKKLAEQRRENMWTRAVGDARRPHPELQARVAPNTVAPSFLTFWKPSDVFAYMTPDLLAPNVGNGTFLPRPSAIWGQKDRRFTSSLETLTIIWKLLVLRPCLFKRGDLTAKDTYLGSQKWRDILTRAGSDTHHSAIWTSGKRELWGSQLLPSVVRRVREGLGEPTISNMDGLCQCSPIGKFSAEDDPQQARQHFVLFRLLELNVLHDFASYHPDLQLQIQGRWCPPPFDAQDALDARPGAFPGLSVDLSDAESKAIEDILTVVRWKGREGVRGWESQDGTEYREWLAAFRTLLSQCPGAWDDNPALKDLMERKPGVNFLSCKLDDPDAPLKAVTMLLVQTHMLLCMRRGRIPWPWFNKPSLNSLRCLH